MQHLGEQRAVSALEVLMIFATAWGWYLTAGHDASAAYFSSWRALLHLISHHFPFLKGSPSALLHARPDGQQGCNHRPVWP